MEAKFFTRKQITLWIVLAFIGFNLGLFINYISHTAKPKLNNTISVSKQNTLVSLSAATLLPQPQNLKPFALLSTNKKPFTNQNLIGQWNLFYFGFTNCAAICPATMSLLNKVYSKLQTDKVILPQIVFISLDPDRDSLNKIQQFVTSFNGSFKGVTGSKPQIAGLTKELSVLYFKVQKAGSQSSDYQLEHSGSIVLLDPQGRFYGIFSTPLEADNIAKDLEKIMANNT